MLFFILFFVCFACFADGENDGWIWSAWNRFTSGAGFLVGAANPCDEKALFGSVCRAANNAKNKAVSTVYEGVSGWWWDKSRYDKAIDLFIGAMLVSGIIVISEAAPAVYAGGWMAAAPVCFAAKGGGCDFAESFAYGLRSYPVMLAVFYPGVFLARQGAKAVKNIVNFSADCSKAFVAHGGRIISAAWGKRKSDEMEGFSEEKKVWR